MPPLTKRNSSYNDGVLTNLYCDEIQHMDSYVGHLPKQNMEKGYDVVVVGGGPAGMACAIQIATLGHSALIVDKTKMNPNSHGVGSSFGAPTGIFSKVLRDVGKEISVKSLRAQGLDDDVIWKQIMKTCAKLIKKNERAQIDLLARFQIDYVQGSGKLVRNGRTVSVAISLDEHEAAENDVLVPAGKILLATGSKASRSDHPFDGVRIFDADTINGLSFLPKSVAIEGGGVIAIEFAKIFRTLGCEVSLILRGDDLTSALRRMGMDEDVATEFVQSVLRDGIRIFTNTKVQRIIEIPCYAEYPLVMQLKSTKANAKEDHIGLLKADIFLASIGREAALNSREGKVDDLGLEAAEVMWRPKHGILVNQNTFQTTNPNIYAVGDVIGPPGLASTGAAQGRIAARAMMEPENFNNSMDITYPIGIWTTPEISFFGYTKKEAEKDGRAVEEGIAYFRDCLRGRISSHEGLLKLVFEKSSGVVLGCHIIGGDACELIHFGMDLVRRKVSIFVLIDEVFTAVTLHELFKEAAIDGDSRLKFGAALRNIFNGPFPAISDGKIPSTSKLKQLFCQVASDGVEEINAEELHDLFGRLGMAVNKAECCKPIQGENERYSETINFEQFARIILALMS